MYSTLLFQQELLYSKDKVSGLVQGVGTAHDAEYQPLPLASMSPAVHGWLGRASP